MVIGGDAAGMSAAAQARRRRPPDDLDIVVFERGRYTSYSACGIPYWIGDSVGPMDVLITRSPEKHRANGLDVRIRSEVTAIDLAGRLVTVHDLDRDERYDQPWDQLLIATGSTPLRPPIPGIDAVGVHGVQVLGDGVALREDLDAGARRIVVIGGGYIGLEIAEAMKQRDLAVTVVDRSATPVGSFDPDIGEFIAGAVRGLGIDLILGESATRITTADGRAVGVETSGGRLLPADVVVLGLGVRPNVELARAAGVPLGPSGGIAVDRRMRAMVPRVWAAGDCVESTHRTSQRPAVVALGTHANKQGRVAGINLGGGYAEFPGVIGTAVTKICSLEVARTGLSEVEAADAGFEFVTASVDSTTRAGYFPGAKPIRVKMIAERRRGRLLGAQIVGEEGAAKRIDVLATAIWNEMNVDDILGLDLSYAPPFAPVWDPVLIAARKAFDAVERDIAAHTDPS